MGSAIRIGMLYAIFAAIASATNLATQWLLMNGAAVPGFTKDATLVAAIGTGTGTGLILKYVLDKRFIFKDRSKGITAHAQRFWRYLLGGLLTTTIFWITELLFAFWDPTGNLIYLGGAIGLAIGYSIKYCIDQRYVFTPQGAVERSS
jgi:hypothetical protein